MSDTTERAAGMSETPKTDQAFDGDLSVGLVPEICTFAEAKEMCRHLERELADATAKIELLKVSYMATADQRASAERKVSSLTADLAAALAALAEAADVADLMVVWAKMNASHKCVNRWRDRADRWRRAAGANAQGNDAKGETK